MSHFLKALVCGGLLAGLILAACQPAEMTITPDPVTLQLKWVHQASFAGFYVAQEAGYFADENLAVTLLEGGPGVDVLQQVASGQADFGVAAPEMILMRRSQGDPVVAIATILQASPVVFAALRDSGIQHPIDLYGRKVAIAGVIDYETQLNAIFDYLGLDINQVEIVPHSYDLTPLYTGQIDCIGLYANGGVLRLRQAGYQANLIWPGDYGVHLPADTLVARSDLLDQNPDLARRFLRASLRGWQEALGNPEAALNATIQYAREADPALQSTMIAASLPLVHTGEEPIGWMQIESWQDLQALMLELGLLDRAVHLDQVIQSSFLNPSDQISP